MKILANQKIKFLFFIVLLASALSALVSAVFVCLDGRNAVLWVLLSSSSAGIAALAALYLYFREQNKLMENAIAQIRDYTAGNRDARIECDEEGELYRLFHEVNSLVARLNAHAENEEHSRILMKNTLSDISHQLKTPLAALNIYNGLIQEEAQDDPAIKEFVSLSEKELERIGTLVQNLLKIARLDAGTIILEKSPENVSEMMAGIGRHFAHRARQERKTFTLSGDEGAVLLCDQTWLTEAVSNIVKNAFDHTKEGASISIEWKEFSGIVQIVVRDNGSGIHPEDLPHIFKRFYCSRFSQDTQGAGLGLPLAKAIIEAHGGTIETDSTLGAGTTFTINFLNPSIL